MALGCLLSSVDSRTRAWRESGFIKDTDNNFVVVADGVHYRPLLSHLHMKCFEFSLSFFLSLPWLTYVTTLSPLRFQFRRILKRVFVSSGLKT